MKTRSIVIGAAAAAAIVANIIRARQHRQDHSPSGPADIGFMLAMHAAFRRDLSRLERTAATPTPEVLAGWEVLSRRLLVHHEAEDQDLWPMLRAKTSVPAVDEIVDEHEQIAKALDGVDAALRGGGDRARVAHEFANLVRSHLDHEERAVLPQVERHLTAQEWASFLRTERNRQTPRSGAEFLGWVLDDAEPVHAQAILREIPLPGRLIYRLVMKPLYDSRHLWSTEPTPTPTSHEIPEPYASGHSHTADLEPAGRR
jgi:hemerythrin-like domain-containing protein